MKLSKILASAALITCFSSTAVFASPKVSNTNELSGGYSICSSSVNDKSSCDEKGHNHICSKEKHEEFIKDPIKALQSKKEKINTMLKEGKITKEKADAINALIDVKIKEINEFNKLPLDKKKAKLVLDAKNRLEIKVKRGGITQEKADELLKKYTEKVEKWDGSGYPHFSTKRLMEEK